jgi:hypothetical protein
MQGQGSAVITEARLESGHLKNRGLDPPRDKKFICSPKHILLHATLHSPRYMLIYQCLKNWSGATDGMGMQITGPHFDKIE